MGKIILNEIEYSGSGGSGSSTLEGLTDVTLTSPTDGQALVYDATNQKWVNGGVVGSGGGSAKYTETVLWSGTQTSTGSIQLSESVKNFDQILILWNANESSDAYAKYSYLIAVSDIDYTRTYQYQLISTLVSFNYSSYASLHFSDSTHLIIDEYLNGSSSNLRILKVIGIKWETMQTALIFSEEEREVGVWTDGKPLYQKTISFGALPNNTTKTVAHGISGFDVIFLKKAFALDLTGGYYIELPYIEGNGRGGQIYLTDTDIQIITPGDYSDYTDCYVTICYTKTADAAGSGTWTTKGTYAEHYSTNEQVVGTWIDGSTLYECTVSFNVTSGYSSVQSYSHGIANIDKIINMQAFVLQPTNNNNCVCHGFYFDSSYACSAYVNDGTCAIRYAWGGVAGTAYFTFRYTKSNS